MDRPCYKCGQTVEEGVPFCPHCSAPQIRVILAEPPAQAVLATEPSSIIAESQPASAVVLPVAWSAAFRPCILAALIASVFMSLGLNPFVAMLSVGFLAVVFYRQRWPGSSIRPAAGARLGAVSGALWFAISSIFEALVVLFAHKGPEVRDELMKRINEAASQTSDPQALAAFGWLKTAGGLEFLMVFGVLFALVAAIVLGVAGGALGGALMGRSNRN